MQCLSAVLTLAVEYHPLQVFCTQKNRGSSRQRDRAIAQNLGRPVFVRHSPKDCSGALLSAVSQKCTQESLSDTMQIAFTLEACTQQ